MSQFLVWTYCSSTALRTGLLPASYGSPEAFTSRGLHAVCIPPPLRESHTLLEENFRCPPVHLGSQSKLHEKQERLSSFKWL